MESAEGESFTTILFGVRDFNVETRFASMIFKVKLRFAGLKNRAGILEISLVSLSYTISLVFFNLFFSKQSLKNIFNDLMSFTGNV